MNLLRRPRSRIGSAHAARMVGVSGCAPARYPTFDARQNDVNATGADSTALDPQAELPYGEMSLADLTLWTLGALGLAVASNEEGTYVLQLPEAFRDSFAGAEQIRFTFPREAAGDDDTAKAPAPGAEQPITWQSPLLVWALARLRRRAKAANGVPRDQPQSVHEIAPKLFAPYRIDAGHAHLAGCSLEDRPILRLTFRVSRQPNDAPARFVNLFLDEDGGGVHGEERAALGLDDVVPMTTRPPQLAEEKVERWIAGGWQLAAADLSGERAELVCATIVWCKWAQGKLAILVGENSLEIPFGLWARLLAEGAAAPPEYVCPVSGIRSYHLAATDDGRITAADAIAVCDESQRRVLAGELQTCAVTGRRVLPEYVVACPITQQHIVRASAKTCPMCRQAVSPEAIAGSRCLACRSLARISKADPRMARIFGEHPGLDRWRIWRISETAATYVLVARGLVRRLLAVIDKESLEVVYLARGSRFSSTWTEVAKEQQEELLR